MLDSPWPLSYQITLHHWQWLPHISMFVYLTNEPAETLSHLVWLLAKTRFNPGNIQQVKHTQQTIRPSCFPINKSKKWPAKKTYIIYIYICTYWLLQVLAVGPSNPGIGAHDSWFQVLRSSKKTQGLGWFCQLWWSMLLESGWRIYPPWN